MIAAPLLPTSNTRLAPPSASKPLAPADEDLYSSEMATEKDGNTSLSGGLSQCTLPAFREGPTQVSVCHVLPTRDRCFREAVEMNTRGRDSIYLSVLLG